MWSQAIEILFESYRRSVLFAEQVLIVRSGRTVELELRHPSGSFERTVLLCRD